MTTRETKILVIGGGYAGVMTTLRLAGKTKRQKTQVTLVNGIDYFVQRPLLHEEATGRIPRNQPIKQMLRGTRAQFKQGWVKAILPSRQLIEVETQVGTEQLAYDYLVYALGSAVDRDSVPGVRENAYVLDPFGPLSAADLNQKLRELPPQARIVIVGGGATGVETAAQIKSSYPDFEVSLLSKDEIGAFKGEKVQRHINQSLAEQGVILRPHKPVVKIQPERIVLENEAGFAADLILWAGGFVAPKLAREAGLKVNERRQILVDPFLRSISHPNIYAVGDSAAPVEEPGSPMRMSLFTALISGAQAADNLAAKIKGKQEKPLSFVWYGQGVALGPKDAVGFATYPADKAVGPIYRRMTAVRVRNFFVWYLGFVLEMERRLPGFFFWNGKGRYAKRKKRAGKSLVDPVLN